ncbi:MULTISPECIES: YitT family protein [Pantoea]|uniref:YitT family protein n=1 Tax=Candidatus Pantoea multigeneris TaxID=2608357 RepID=A0ABX0RH81_9GAMM|nr:MULTISPECIES: YitT family protein [Pantoea]NIF22784.1 YitT family protein [Pantoea multigeneris]
MDNVVQQPAQIPHSRIEDALAIVMGTLMVSFGVMLMKQAGALTGSTAGIAFLISYVSPLSFGSAFFLINLPFYWLAVKRMGWEFTIKTFCAVALVSLFTHLHPMYMHFSTLNPIYATLFGNVITGIGFIVLFRHKASLGGVNILALWLQDRIGLRAGKLQMGIDTCVVLASLFVVSWQMLIVSIAGAVILNLIIAMNHRPGRYTV